MNADCEKGAPPRLSSTSEAALAPATPGAGATLRNTASVTTQSDG
jgi:hypothetical protein